jgi:VWFA-related protein
MTTGVLIDVTVLDGHGQPVLDLGPDDFELKEDGVRQQILSITLVNGAVVHTETVRRPNSGPPATVPKGTTPPAASSAADPLPDDTPTVTAILFDRLSPEARPLAARAALAYLTTLSPPKDYAGVFVADLSLRTLQPFTNKPENLRDAVDRLASIATANTADTENPKSKRLSGLDPNAPVTAGAEAESGWVSVAERERRLKWLERNDGVEWRLTQMELRMEEGYRRLLSEYSGQASIAGLRSIVDSLGALPGRKLVLYFTEGLSLTSQIKPKFDTLIGEANRANISFYPVDAAGLRVHSEDAKVNHSVSLAGARGIGDAAREQGAWTKELETQDQLLSSRASAALGRLANQTGGFVIENTNDLSAGVARMQAERTTYYLLAYQPSNSSQERKFRSVTVSVKRAKVRVSARPGYLPLVAGTQER